MLAEVKEPIIKTQTHYCKKYFNAEVISNEEGNCRLCESKLTEQGQCSYF